MLFNAVVPTPHSEKAAWVWAAEGRDQWNAGHPNRLVDTYINYATILGTLEEQLQPRELAHRAAAGSQGPVRPKQPLPLLVQPYRR